MRVEKQQKKLKIIKIVERFFVQKVFDRKIYFFLIVVYPKAA